MSFVHDDKDFDALVRIVANKRRLSLVLVEKDYWATHTLWALLRSGFEVWLKGGTSLSKGFSLIERFSEAIDAHTTAMQVGGRHPWSLISMGIAHVCSGNRTEALAIHEECGVRSRVELGLVDEAFELLARGFDVRDTWMIFLHLPQGGFFDSLREDPRFAEMVERVGAR